MRERLEAKGAPAERLRVIPNWVDTRAITPQPRDNPWAERHGLVSRFVVMHSGNVGHAQDLDSLVRAATFLRDREDIRIVIAGFGARHAEMVDLAARLDVEDMVRFLPYQERDRLPFALERRRPRRRAREGARRLRRAEPPVRDPLGRAAR